METSDIEKLEQKHDINGLVQTSTAEIVQSPLSLPWRTRHAVLLFASIAIIYLLIAAVQYLKQPPGAGSAFINLADGWLHGHLYLQSTPGNTGDFTLHNGHWYLAYPPLPAILLLPFVAIFGFTNQGLLSFAFSIGMGIINIGLMLWVLKQFSQWLVVGLKLSSAMWLLALFAFGTVHLYATTQPSVWYQAHVVATTFLLLYIGETLGKRRPMLAGLYLSLAALSRTTTLLTFPLFLLLTLHVDRSMPGMMWRKLTLFLGVLTLCVMGMLIYNQVRFGSLFDFGYSAMNVNLFLQGNLHRYGQFNLHFVRTNLYYMLLKPPVLLSIFPYIAFNPLGTGIFWTTPALLFAFLAFRCREYRWLAGSLLAACLLPVVSLLLYFNTGWYQFGFRFSLDFLPFALLLAALGMHVVLKWGEKALIVLSMLMNIWGYIIFTFYLTLMHRLFHP
jgi:hypothetical protein